MAITRCAIMANIVKIGHMTVMAHLVIAMISVFMGVFLKYSKNADYWPKCYLKIWMK